MRLLAALGSALSSSAGTSRSGAREAVGPDGGYCDCEIFLNGMTLSPRLLTRTDDGCEDAWPDPLPTCSGVRAGSTQPCPLWVRQRPLGWW